MKNEFRVIADLIEKNKKVFKKNLVESFKKEMILSLDSMQIFKLKAI